MTAKVLGMLDLFLNFVFGAFKKAALYVLVAAIGIALFLVSLIALGYNIVT